jgi:hypothetical protein
MASHGEERNEQIALGECSCGVIGVTAENDPVPEPHPQRERTQLPAIGTVAVYNQIPIRLRACASLKGVEEEVEPLLRHQPSHRHDSAARPVWALRSLQRAYPDRVQHHPNSSSANKPLCPWTHFV